MMKQVRGRAFEQRIKLCNCGSGQLAQRSHQAKSKKPGTLKVV